MTQKTDGEDTIPRAADGTVPDSLPAAPLDDVAAAVGVGALAGASGPPPDKDAFLEPAELIPWSVTEPHDRYMKFLLRTRANVVATLAQLLPAEILAEADLSRVTLAPTEYITPLLKRRQSDLVFILPVGGQDTLLHAMLDLEVQSRNDKTREPEGAGPPRRRCWRLTTSSLPCGTG